MPTKVPAEQTGRKILARHVLQLAVIVSSQLLEVNQDCIGLVTQNADTIFKLRAADMPAVQLPTSRVEPEMSARQA